MLGNTAKKAETTSGLRGQIGLAVQIADDLITGRRAQDWTRRPLHPGRIFREASLELGPPVSRSPTPPPGAFILRSYSPTMSEVPIKASTRYAASDVKLLDFREDGSKDRDTTSFPPQGWPR